MSDNNFFIYKTEIDQISIDRSGEKGALILSGLDELQINSNFNIKNLQNNLVNFNLSDQLFLISNNKFILAFSPSGQGEKVYLYQIESGKSLNLSLGNQFNNGNSITEDFFDLTYKTGNLNLDVGVNMSGNLKVSGTGVFNAVDLNNIDSLTLSGVDINIISGNVGIGTDTPDQKLHVLKTSAGAVTADAGSIAVFEGSGNSHITILTPNAQTAGVVFGSPADNFGSYLSWNHDNHSLKLGTAKPSGFIQLLTNNEAEAVRITSGGFVGIGTNNPSEKLEVAGNIKASGASFTNRPTVNNTGVLLSGQNIFVLQGGTTQSNTSVGDNYLGLAGANIGWSNTSASRRVTILENCVARKASITLQQEVAGNAVSNITGSIVNFTQNLTGTISTTIASNNNNNFINFSNSNLNLPFSAGDNVGVLINSQLVITGLRAMANVYFYN
jgi:hypothetical protein